MKTAVEIPEELLRRARSAAAQKGIPLREFVSDAVAEKLGMENGANKPWLKAFGGLRSLHKETQRINRIIDAEFNHLEPEDLQ